MKQLADELYDITRQMIVLNEMIERYVKTGEYEKAKSLLEAARALKDRAEEIRENLS